MRRKRTQITVWPALTDLMTSIVVIAVLIGVVGFIRYADMTGKVDSLHVVIEKKDAEIVQKLIARGETRKEILGQLKDRLEKYNMEVDTLSEQGVLRLSENVINFESGSTTPISEHDQNIGRLAEALAEVAPCHVFSGRAGAIAQKPVSAGVQLAAGKRPAYCQPVATLSAYTCEKKEHPWLLETILIEGHTDTVGVDPTVNRKFDNNLELSSLRATNVYGMISSCEPGIQRMHNSDSIPVLSTSGYGEMRPATLDTSEYEKNRRIDIRLLLEQPPEGALLYSDSSARE